MLLISQCGTLSGFLLLYFAHFLARPDGAGAAGAAAIFLLYFSRVLDGISGGNISTATAYIADITTPENRAKGMGLIGAAFGMGFVFGPFIGGVVGKQFGLQYVPLTAAVFSLSALLMTFFTLPESHHPGDKTEDLRRFSVQGLRHALARPVIGGLIMMSFVNGFAFAGMEQTFSLLIQERAFPSLDKQAAAQQSSGAAGYLFGSIGIIIVFVQGGLIGRLTKAFGEAILTAVGPLCIAMGLVIVGMAGEFGNVWTALVIGSGLLALGSSLFNPSVQSLISRHANKREQGEILGAAQGMASLARGVGPLLAGFLFWKISSGMPYYVSAGICLIVAIWAITMRTKLRPPASVPASADVLIDGNADASQPNLQ